MEQPQEVNKHLNIWPPGTIRIGDLYKAKGEDIILQPQPTDDPTILSIGPISENIGTSSSVLSLSSWYLL